MFYLSAASIPIIIIIHMEIRYDHNNSMIELIVSALGYACCNFFIFFTVAITNFSKHTMPPTSWQQSHPTLHLCIVAAGISPPFNLQWNRGDTRHLSMWKRLWLCERHSKLNTIEGPGGWDEGDRRVPAHSWGLYAPSLTWQYISPESTFIWAQSFFLCDFIDKDTNIFELWAVVLQRQTVFYSGVLRGPDSPGQWGLLGG